MSLFIAYANITKDYPLYLMDNFSLSENINQPSPRKKHRQVAYFLLWQLLKKAKLTESWLQSIYRDEQGRPHFSEEHIDFNLSHSGDWVAVALSVQPKGINAVTAIDIEHVKRKRNYTALLAHFGTQEEQSWFQNSQFQEQDFYQIWCLRETILKVEGAGIGKLNSIKSFPQQCVMMTDYCPQGKAFFYRNLPFYLAFFSLQEENHISIFEWQENMLKSQDLKKDLCYQINP